MSRVQVGNGAVRRRLAVVGLTLGVVVAGGVALFFETASSFFEQAERAATSAREKISGFNMAAPRQSFSYQCFRSLGSVPPFSAIFCMTCLCSQMFMLAESSVSPV